MNTTAQTSILSSNDGAASSISHNLSYYNFDVTNIVDSWYNHNSGEYGFKVTYYDQTITDYNSLYSANCGIADYVPKLYITYDLQTSGITNGATYFIRSVASECYMDIYGFGTDLQLCNFNGGTNQQFTVVYEGNGYYSFTPVFQSSYRLDVYNAADADGAQMWIYPSNNSPAQRYKICDSGSGSFYIMPQCSTTRVLDAWGAFDDDGIDVRLCTYHAGANQKWVFEKTESGNYSRGITSTISTERQNAWAISENDYNCWPATTKSKYYGWNTLSRDIALAASNTIALTLAAGGNWTIFPNSGNMLNHFLFETGTPLSIDFKYVNNHWDYADLRRKKWIDQALSASEELSVLNKEIIFYSKTEEHNDAPATVNDFKYSIGSYYSHIKCDVLKTNSTTYQATIYYTLEDIYDWDPTDTAKIKGIISPQDLWELHHGGVSKHYQVSGTNTLTITWTQGQRYDTGANITDVE